MRLQRGLGQIPFVNPRVDVQTSFDYNAIHTTSFQNFDQLHLWQSLMNWQF
jgi:hypothetical protein